LLYFIGKLICSATIKINQRKTNMKKLILGISSTLCLLFIQPVSAQLATFGHVYLNADEGSWVGGGIGANEVTWTHGNEGIFNISTNDFNYGAFISFLDGKGWSFNFVAPTYDPLTNTNNGNPLQVGFYNNATRHPFNSPTRPGLDFSGNGRGNNMLGGWFDILEIEYNPTFNELISLAVDFRQFDERENMSGPSTFGSLRINSNLALNYTGQVLTPVPETETYALLGIGLLFLGFTTRNKSKSFRI